MATTSQPIYSGKNGRKICGTCQYWNCESREIKFMGKNPQSISVDLSENNHDAFCKVSGNKRTISGTCPKWKPWVDL